MTSVRSEAVGQRLEVPEPDEEAWVSLGLLKACPVEGVPWENPDKEKAYR